jgi:hypothetical protein
MGGGHSQNVGPDLAIPHPRPLFWECPHPKVLASPEVTKIWFVFSANLFSLYL